LDYSRGHTLKATFEFSDPPFNILAYIGTEHNYSPSTKDNENVNT